MGCQSSNATAPSHAVAPGLDFDSPDHTLRAAERVAASFDGAGIDPRIPELVPGFDAPFCQAGLAGYSDAPMRLIARRHGCPCCVTEALLDRTLLAGGRGFVKADLGDLADNVPGGDDDLPLVGQIMGSEPVEMAAASVKMVEQGARRDRDYRDLAYDDPTHHRVRTDPEDLHASAASRGFAAIDVNLACPVKKIAKKARGGHWLAQPEGAIRILEAVREAVPRGIPTTVKMRRAFDDTQEMRESFYRIFDAAYDMGYAWVTVHGRTVEQKYVGPSRWDLLREITSRRHPGRHTDRIVFGSGDVWRADDIVRMIDYAGVSAVSVARGCIGDPWIFRRARDLLAGRVPRPPTLAEQRAALEQHFELALAANRRLVRRAEQVTGRTMRKFAIRFAAHHPDPAMAKDRFVRAESIEDWRTALDACYPPQPLQAADSE